MPDGKVSKDTSDAGSSNVDTEPAPSQEKLELRICDLETKVLGLEQPFYKRSKFWGATIASVGLLLGYVASAEWPDEPTIPRLLHQYVLKTDKAIAENLRLASNADENISQRVDPELRQQIQGIVSDAMLPDGENSQRLIDEFVKKQTHAYHGSVVLSYFEVPLPDCQIATLDFLHRNAEDEKKHIASAEICNSKGAITTINVTQSESLLLPYKADESDRVTVYVTLEEVSSSISQSDANKNDSETQIDEESDIHRLKPSEFLEYTLQDNIDDRLPVPDDNGEYFSKIDVSVSGNAPIRKISIQLNEKGNKRLFSKANDTAKFYIISAIALVEKVGK